MAYPCTKRFPVASQMPRALDVRIPAAQPSSRAYRPRVLYGRHSSAATMLAAAAAEAPTDGAVPYTAVVSRPKTAGGKAAALVRVTRTFDFKDLTPFQACAILVDKPEGWTSFDVVNKVRGALDFLKVVKVGHAGRNPAAGNLPVPVCQRSCSKLYDVIPRTVGV